MLNVLIVYNADWTGDQDGDGTQDSLQVAQYYELKRSIPSLNVLGVHCGTSNYEYATYLDFYNGVVAPLQAKLTAIGPTAVDVILLMYGIPVHVPVSSNIVSIDNILAVPGPLTSSEGSVTLFASNPYQPAMGPTFQADLPHFSHGSFQSSGHTMYLVSRIDGPLGLYGALGLIDQARYADLYLMPGNGYYNGTIYGQSAALFTDAELAAKTEVQSGDYFTTNGVDYNISQSRTYVHGTGFGVKWNVNTNSGFIGAPASIFIDYTNADTAPNAMVYVGWYHQPPEPFGFIPGAIYCDLNSNSVQTLRTPGGAFATKALELGATCMAGDVNEPTTTGCPKPNVLLYYLLKGYPFAEAATLSIPQFGWMSIAVGDPLYAPFLAKTPIQDTQFPVLTAAPVVTTGLTALSKIISFSVLDTPHPEVVRARIDYGLTTAYGLTVTNGTPYWRVHALSLANLQNNTTYHYRLTLTDPVGNQTVVPDATFDVGTPAFPSAPVLAGISAASDMVQGGTTITLTGNNFLTGMTVQFGSVFSPTVAIINATSATAVVPANTVGVYNVTVTNTDTQTSSLAAIFTYLTPPVVTVAAAATANSSNNYGLSVTGTWGANTALLKYVWSVVSSPPGPVSFLLNGTLLSNNCNCLFIVPGPYTLRVTLVATDGSFATSEVSFTVSMTLNDGGTIPPSLETATSATPNPVLSGVTTDLSVQAFPDNVHGLWYYWTLVSGPAPVTFSAQGVSGGAPAVSPGTTTAHFTQAGAYTIRSTISTFAISNLEPVTTSDIVINVGATGNASGAAPVVTLSSPAGSASGNTTGSASGPAPVVAFSSPPGTAGGTNMSIIYKATFPGSATSPALTAPAGITDTCTVGTPNLWTQESLSWFTDGSGHITSPVDADYESFAVQPSNHVDSGVVVPFGPMNAQVVGGGFYKSWQGLVFRRNNSGSWGSRYSVTFSCAINTGLTTGAIGITSTFSTAGSFPANVTGGALSFATVIDVATAYSLRGAVTGTSPTTLTFQLLDVAGNVLETLSITDSDGPQTTGKTGVCGAAFAPVISGFQIDDGTLPPPVATAFTLTGPTTGIVGSPSTNFTFTPTGGVYTGTITPTDASGGGTFTPSSLTWATSSTGQTCTYTAANITPHAINGTASPSLTQPSSITYTATTGLATAFTLTGPTTGLVGAPSTNFTFTPTGGNYTGTITPTDASGGGSFTPSSLSWSTSSTAKTCTYTAANTTPHAINGSSSPALTPPSSVTYTASNPSTTKPANPTLLSGDPTAATMIACLPMCESVAGSLPLDIVSRKISRPQNTALYQTALGPQPHANGFAGGTIVGVSQRFVSNGPSICCGNTNSAPVSPGFPVTHAVVMKFGAIDPSGSLALGQSYQITSSETQFLGHGIHVTVNSGTPTQFDVAYLGGAGNAEVIVTGLDPTHWYAIAASVSSASVVTMRVYDLTTSTLVTGAGGVAHTMSGGNMRFAVADSIFTLGVAFGAGFAGELAIALCDGELWNDTIFAAFTADPWAVARGPAPVGNGGSLVAGDAWAESRETGILLRAAFPTGGVNAHVYAYQWERSANPIWTPGTGTVVSGATTAEYLDTTAAVNTNWFYVCRQTDGTTTVYSPVVFGCRLNGYHKSAWIGTSLVEIGTPVEFGVAAMAAGYACININAGRGATSASQWDPISGGHNWLASVLAVAVANGCTHLHIQHGTNDGSGAGFVANMNDICAATVAAGLICVLHYAPLRWDILSSQQFMTNHVADLDAVATDPIGFPTLVRGTNVLPCDTDRTARASARWPYLLQGDHLHWSTGTPTDLGIRVAGSGIWTSFLTKVLEPANGSTIFGSEG